MQVREVISKFPLVLGSEDTLESAAKRMIDLPDYQFPVVDSCQKYLGMINKNDLLQLFLNGADWKTPIKQFIDDQKQISCLYPDQKLSAQLIEEDYTPVCSRDGFLLGACTYKGLADHLFRERKRLKGEITTLLQSSTNAIVVVDKNGYITGFNQAAEKIVGIRGEEAIGKWIGDVISESELPEVLKTGQHQYNRKLMINGIAAISNRSPIIKDGEITGAIGMFQDVSELESVSKQLKITQELKAELDAIIESSYDGIYVTDGEGRTMRVNSAYERITGVKGKEVIGETMDELVRRGYYNDSATLHVLKRREPVTIMQKIKSKIEVIVTGNPIFDEKGQIIRVVTNVRDITELNSLREQLEETKLLSERYHLELEQLRIQQLQQGKVIARSPEMQKVLDLAARVAQVNSTVLISGESGVGKEVVAKMIHSLGNRKTRALIKINCGAIPENLLESELFGYSEGAFTGARKEGKPGMIELADGGTLLLDEIGEMPFPLQVKLLRVLQEQEITRVGGTKPIKVDVRFIAATNRDLEEMVAKGLFREDLYYRLNVITIKIPALKNRCADIPPMIAYFINKFNQQYGKNKQISQEAVEALTNYNWPGNVRELENVIERLMIMVDERKIEFYHLPDYIRKGKDEEDFKLVLPGIIPLRQAVEEVESNLISLAIKKHKTMEHAAKALGVNRTTVLRKMQKYNLPKS
jgi:PAS domain S-box-containing protein